VLQAWGQPAQQPSWPGSVLPGHTLLRGPHKGRWPAGAVAPEPHVLRQHEPGAERVLERRRRPLPWQAQLAPLYCWGALSSSAQKKISE